MFGDNSYCLDNIREKQKSQGKTNIDFKPCDFYIKAIEKLTI